MIRRFVNVTLSRGIYKLRQDGLFSLLSSVWKKVIIKVSTYIRPYLYHYQGYSVPPSPMETIKINPSSISHQIASESPVYKENNKMNYGKIRDGDWDQIINSIETSSKYQACRLRVENDVPWTETGIIDQYMEWIQNGDGKIDGCQTRKDVVNLYKSQREELYQNLKKEGFNTEYSKSCCDVHIDRDGRLIFARQGGRHRLSLCKLLDIEEVPVRVCYRHKQWQKKREAIAKDQLSPEMFGIGSSHPDLNRIT